MEQSTFTDSDGILWTVREDGAEDSRLLNADVSPGTAWLRFESDLEVRRLWHYPDDWRGLSPIQLESLLDRASTVIARFRPVPHRADVAAARGTRDDSSSDHSTPERSDNSCADLRSRDGKKT